MKSVQRWLAPSCALFALAHCSSSPPPRPVTAPPPQVAAPPPIDLSPVPVPASLVLTARTPSPRAMLEHLGELTGMGRALVQTSEQALPSMFGRDEALANVVDLSAPADLAVYYVDHHEHVVISFGAVSLDRAETLLSDGHSLTAGPNDVRRIERTGDEGLHGISCVLAPAAGATARRLVCAEREDEIAPMLGYLTRTLPASPLASDAGDLVVEAPVAQLQEALAGDARRASEEMVRDTNPDPDPNNPAFQQAVRDWVRELAQTIPQGLADLASVRLAVALPPTGATATLDVGLARSTAPYVRQLLEATADATLPVELLQHLPGGGWSYGAGALSLTPIRPTVNLLASTAAWAIVPDVRLPPADATALRDAIAALAAQDRLSGAYSVGTDDQGRYWSASAVQLTTPPAQFVANARTLLAALRRRPIANAIRQEHRMDVSRWQEVRGRDVPAGALLLRIPPPAEPTPPRPERPVRPTRTATPPTPPIELLLVPSGTTLWVVVGADARAQHRAALAQTASPVAVERISGEGVAFAGAIVPSGLVNTMHREPQMASSLRESLQRSADHGQTPATLRLTRTTSEGRSHLGGRLELPQPVIRLIAGMFVSTSTPRP